MQRHFDEDLKRLKAKLLKMGSMVEEQIHRSIKSLIDRDSDLAQKTIEKDHKVNALEVEIDEECIRLIALYQPKSSDLRFITTGMKIITDLERISDLAVNICERAQELNKESQLKPYIDIPRMAEASSKMLKDSLKAFVNRDTNLALKVCRDDEIVNELNRQIIRELITFMMENPHTITRAIKIMFISRYLERIGDHATNIAEIVVYLVEGKVIRHTV
ncbi:MAG: phosphate signaling complex protein PhoU [Nitrospirota bacterium]